MFGIPDISQLPAVVMQQSSSEAHTSPTLLHVVPAAVVVAFVAGVVVVVAVVVVVMVLVVLVGVVVVMVVVIFIWLVVVLVSESEKLWNCCFQSTCHCHILYKSLIFYLLPSFTSSGKLSNI